MYNVCARAYVAHAARIGSTLGPSRVVRQINKSRSAVDSLFPTFNSAKVRQAKGV